MWLDAFNEMRRNSGLSLDDLSSKSGVPKGTLAKITSGITRTPSLETMRSLVYAMGYTLDDLYCASSDSPAPVDEQRPEDEQRLIAYYKKASSYDQHAILRFAEYVTQSAIVPSKEVIEEEARLAAQSLIRQSRSQLETPEVAK